MAKEIDEKVVSMKFDNKHFMDNTSETISRIDKLKAKLHFSGASKGLEEVNKAANNTDLSPMSNGIEQVGIKFNALQVMATTALMNITNAAMNAGMRIASALTIDPIKTGLAEYETQINAVQTILANTESKGTTLDDVNKALDQLNTYADKTIYNFTEMTRNIGTFTAAGVDLDTSVNAIQGIANLAAVSGSSSQQASTAMYQLSQALASGTVKLMDWNSVVNAGMGGQVFQDALKETARVHGVAIDDMIEENGSFRETLQEGWLTSEILTETLQKFTLATEGLTEEQIEQNRAMLKSKGYTDEQIEGIFKLGNTATNAATKVKTFSQLIDTLKESAQSGWTQTWEILVGDFEEAKTLWTSVSDVFGKMISASAEARNVRLQDWAEGGGRTAMIESFKNAWEALLSVIRPIKEAFREIFPKKTAEQMIKTTEAIKEFTSKLILSEKAQQKLKSAFKGLFAVIDVFLTVIKEIAKGVMKILGCFGDLVGSILGIGGSFGEWISGIRDTIKESNIFSTVINGIVNVLQKFINAIKIVVSYLKEKFVSPGFEGFLGLMNGIWNVMKFIGEKIMQVFSVLGKGLLSAFRNGDIKTAMEIFNTGIIGGILLNFKKFTDGFKSFGEIAEGVGGILDSVKGCFQAWQKDIQAKTLLKIATAIAILAAAILVIASIDPSRLAASLGAVTVLFADLMGSMAIFTHIGGSFKGIFKASVSMIAISIAISILASALKKVASVNPDDLERGLLGVAALSAIVVVVAAIMSKNEKKIIKGATGLIAFALAIRILASACNSLSSLSWEGLIKGLVGVGALMAGVSIFLNKTKFSLKSIVTATGMVILAAAIKILASACASFSRMSWEEMIKGLSGMAAALTLVTIALNLMPKNMLGLGIGLLGVSTSLVILASALRLMGGMSWESIGKSLLVLGGALVILAVGLHAMTGTLAGTAALLIATMAITMLIPPLLILSLMSWESIIKGLVTLAGTFVILGVAGAVLTPLVPAILALSAAILLIGIGVTAAGVGMIALAAGISALAIAFTTSMASIVAGITLIITSIIGLIPSIVAAIGEGIILICNIIAGSVGAICNAVAAIIVAVCDAVIKAIPKLIEVVGKLLDALLDFLIKYIPIIVDAGMKIIAGFLDGIAQNIGLVVEKAVLVVTKFIEGISSQIPNLIQCAFDFILDLVNALGDAIETYTPLIVEAAIGLGGSIIQGLIEGMFAAIGSIGDVLASIGNGIINGFKNLFGIHSPARKMIPIGRYIDEGIVVGLEKYKGAVVGATEDVGSTAVDSMANAISGISDAVNSDIDMQPVIRPVLDLSSIETGAGLINDMFRMTPSVDVMSNVGAINSMMNGNQNGESFDIVSAIKDLGSKISGMPGNTYIIDGITYDDGSNVANAINDLVRAAKIERRI